MKNFLECLALTFSLLLISATVSQAAWYLLWCKSDVLGTYTALYDGVDDGEVYSYEMDC